MSDSDGRLDTDGARADRALEWFLLDGNRLVIAGTLLVAVFALLSLIVGNLDVTGRESRPTFYLFSALIGGNITLVTVVLSINQLVLSRELETPGEVRSEMRNTTEYRRDVEESTGRNAVPVTPSEFLQLLVESTHRQAQVVGKTISETDDRQVRAEVNDLVEQITGHMDYVDGLLTQSGSGIFNVLSTVLDTDYAEQINHVHRIQSKHEETLSDVTNAELDTLVDEIKQLNVARQYFKSLYIQEELSYLSRVLLYVGIPAVVSSILGILVFALPNEATPTILTHFTVLPVLNTIGLAPLAALFAFMLRIATVTQRTAAITPFITIDEERGVT